MTSNEKWGLALVSLGVLIVLGLLAWVAWDGAKTTTQALDVAPKLDVPDLPVPNLPDGPRLPNAPVPRPQ
jgi:hypothetical protein